MDQPADFRLERAPDGAGRVSLSGDWTSTGLGRAGVRLTAALRSVKTVRFDLSRLGRVDTAGAYVLAQATARAKAEGLTDRADAAHLLALVNSVPEEAHGRRRPDAIYLLLVRVGQGVVHLFAELFLTFGFYGHLLAALGRLIVNPARIRIAPTVSLMERAGLDALPIVATTNFFVGATLAFLGANLLAQFGASIFAVELIGIGVLREFGVLITAVILAGRSASSFAAEIGAMRMNQEVDAMQVMGVDPFEALVIPRFIALLTMMPLLTFVAMVAGLAGGMLVVWSVLDLSPAFFLQRLLDNVGQRQFWIGIVKAPVLAVVIAAIGCRQGMEVGGDVEQLGRRVTTAVVQGLFSLILIDALFALLFMELGQ
jgi:phospholipid/cholesterol/gamma-HCH transport system permease protein